LLRLIATEFVNLATWSSFLSESTELERRMELVILWDAALCDGEPDGFTLMPAILNVRGCVRQAGSGSHCGVEFRRSRAG
jgi:hypothetical protein